MAQRHEHDTVERLPWEGAADPKNARYVPIELRVLVADIPAADEEKFRRELYVTPEIIRTDGRQARHTLNPSTDPDDLETALVWRKVEWARRQLVAEHAEAARRAHDQATYSCHCCGDVVTPGSVDRNHTMLRTFVDGSQARVCGKCAPILERIAVDALGAEIVDGISRADRARALLAKATP